MDRERLAAEVRLLRAQGRTPKTIAKTLGITRGEAAALIRMVAREAASSEPLLVGCWVSAGWSRGLSWTGHEAWREDASDDDPPGLVSVLVAREQRYDRVTACAYLVDAQCLGVKDAFRSRVLDRAELDAFVRTQFRAYDRPPLSAPIELARELVFGAEAYARQLGFAPHRDFESCREHLGSWNGPDAIVFGYHGKPFFAQGLDDDADTIVATLKRSVGSGEFEFVVAEHAP